MGSVDGRLLPGRWTPPFDETPVSELFKEYGVAGAELDTDAWMFGKATTAEFFPERFQAGNPEPATAGELFKAARHSKRLFITIDPDADIRYSASTLRGDDILAVVSTKASVEYLAALAEKGISFYVAPDITDLRHIMTVVCEEFGVRRISLQGGGIINGAMLAAGLLDELSLVVYPGIDGLASAPSIFEYTGADGERPESGQSLEFVNADVRAHGIVWLRYRFHHGTM